jgi:hypothetical protein
MDTGQDTGTPLADAAALMGTSVAALRKRLQRGSVPGYKRDGQWYVLVDTAHIAGSPRPPHGQAAGVDTGQPTGSPPALVSDAARAQLEAIRDEWLQPLVAQIAEQAERIGRLEAEKEDLRRRAEAAEQEAATLRARPSAPTLSQDAPNVAGGTAEPSATERGTGGGRWGRVRRWWTREG